MAVVRIQPSAKGSIKLQAGMSAGGNPIYRYVNFYGIKSDAQDVRVFAVLKTLSELQSVTVAGIMRTDAAHLVEQ